MHRSGVPPLPARGAPCAALLACPRVRSAVCSMRLATYESAVSRLGATRELGARALALGSIEWQRGGLR